MLGRRWKRTVNLKNKPGCPEFLGVPEPSDSSSSSESSNMAPRAPPPVHSYAETLVFGPGETLGRGDGSWDDVEFQFVECRENPAPLEYYYRDLSEVYGGPDGTEGREPYDQAKLDRMFLNSPGTHYPCVPIHARVRSMYPDSRKDDAVRAAFHFDEG